MNEKRRIVVYSFDPQRGNTKRMVPNDVRIEKWTPSLIRILPPNTGLNYFIFWVAHYFRIFKNRSYCAYLIKLNNQTISSLVCVPAIFIWPFMGNDDIQIKSVYTHQSFRGKSLAQKLIEAVIAENNNENRTIWYMTHTKNYASLRLSEKAGFEFQGYYTRKFKKYRIIGVGTLSKKIKSNTS